MPASSTLLVWKFPLDFVKIPLSVQLAVLQRDRNTPGLPDFHHDFCVRLLMTTDGASVLLHRTGSRRGVTAPCVFAAKRTIWSHLLLKEEWCREMNHEFTEKRLQRINVALHKLKWISQETAEGSFTSFGLFSYSLGTLLGWLGSTTLISLKVECFTNSLATSGMKKYRRLLFKTLQFWNEISNIQHEFLQWPNFT